MLKIATQSPCCQAKYDVRVFGYHVDPVQEIARMARSMSKKFHNIRSRNEMTSTGLRWQPSKLLSHKAQRHMFVQLMLHGPLAQNVGKSTRLSSRSPPEVGTWERGMKNHGDAREDSHSLFAHGIWVRDGLAFLSCRIDLINPPLKPQIDIRILQNTVMIAPICGCGSVAVRSSSLLCLYFYCTV